MEMTNEQKHEMFKREISASIIESASWNDRQMEEYKTITMYEFWYDYIDDGFLYDCMDANKDFLMGKANEFEDGTKHMAFPEEITKIERERQTLAQNLHKEEEKPINQTNTMDRYEQIKNKLESFASEDELVEMWNKYVAENRETLYESITIYLNTADNLAMFMTWMSKEGMAVSLLNGNYDSRDRYIYECADRLYTANSMFAIISTEGLERFYDDYISPAKMEWEKDSAKAITLWNQPYEEVKVEITKDWVKFFRRDDMLTCYTYRPLHLLKCDNYFIGRVKATLEESCQYNEEEFNNWLKNDCDMPPFPISVIFTSDYTEYTCKVYGE